MNDEKVSQGKNLVQSILLLIAYLFALWIITALWLWLGGVIALGAGGYYTTWLIAGLTLLSRAWITWMGLQLIRDLFSSATAEAKRLLTVIYQVAALPQLALLLLGFFLYWENTKN